MSGILPGLAKEILCLTGDCIPLKVFPDCIPLKALNGIGADGVWEKDSLDIRAEAWKEYFLLRRLFSSLKVFASSIIYVCALSIFKEGLKVYVTYSTRGHNLS